MGNASRLSAIGSLLMTLALVSCRSTGGQGESRFVPSPLHQADALDRPTGGRAIVATGDLTYPASVAPIALTSAVEPLQENGTSFTPQYPAAIAAATPKSDIAPSQALTLDDAIGIALDRTPTLVALRASEPVARAVYGVAATYPWNPYVQLEVLPYARESGGNLGAVTNYVLLMQTLELAHQKSHREATAAAALDQVRWNVVQAELTSVAQAERLYFAALYQRDIRDLQRETAALTNELDGIVERRFEATLATAAEQTMARVAARQCSKQAALAEATYQTALLALQRQIALVGEQRVELTGRLEDFSWLTVEARDADSTNAALLCTPPESLAAELASVRPDVMAAAAGVNAARAGANLARANRIPNLQAGPFYEHDDAGTIFAGFRAQTDLPVWNNGKPLVAQREAELRQQLTTLDQLRTRATVEAETAIERYELARQILAEGNRNMPEMSNELQHLRDQYEAGQANILNVFAAQTSLLQERRVHLDLLNELAQAAADVTLTTGMPPARLIRSARPAGLQPEALPAPVESQPRQLP